MRRDFTDKFDEYRNEDANDDAPKDASKGEREKRAAEAEYYHSNNRNDIHEDQ